MNLTFQLLIFSHIRTNLAVFILSGLLAYFIDYRRVNETTSMRREAIFVKVTSVTFVLGGILVLCLYQLLFWIA